LAEKLVAKCLLLGVVPLSLYIATLTVAPSASADRASEWRVIENTALIDVCPDAGLHGYDYPANCQNIVYAWGSGALDAERGRLYLWGGGHNDYYGNEVYVLDVHRKTMERLTEPAPPADPKSKPAQSQLAPFNGTQPNARHTYDGMAFMPSQELVWAFSGALAGKIGPLSDSKTWLFNPSSGAWSLDDSKGEIPSPAYGVVSAFDPVTEKVFLHDRTALYSYTFDSEGGTYEKLNAQRALGLGLNAAIDPENRRMLIIGNGQQILYDLKPTSGYRRIPAPLKGDADFIRKHNAPGLAYNSKDGHLYAWPGDGKLYRFHMDTLSWEGLAFNGDPGPQARHGTFGRFDYVPSLNSFVLLNNPREDAYLFRLPTHADNEPPTGPTNLLASHPYPGALALHWQAATDNFGVAGYRVFANGKLVAEVNDTQFKSMQYKPRDTVVLQVRAFDSAGHESAKSPSLQVTMPALSPRMRLGDCRSERRLATREDIVFCEPWDSDSWWKTNGWLRDPIVNDPRPMTETTGKYTRVIREGCISGQCLEVTMEEGKTGALSAYWPLANANLAPERLFMRYYLKLGDDWDVNMCRSNGDKAGAGGKFPGLADVRTWADPGGQCGNGGASGDGINCWSMRLNFSDCKGEICEAKPAPAMRLGSYMYYALQKGSTGQVGFWDEGWKPSRLGECESDPGSLYCGQGTGGILERGYWYQIEMQVQMNTPGKADGVIRGWIDGELSYEKTNIVLRKEGHDFLHNRLAWFNIYKGGLNGNCQTSKVYLDQMVIALDRPAGGLEGHTRAPPDLVLKASSLTPSSDQTLQIQWSTEHADQCKAAGLWSGEKAASGWEALGPMDRSGTLQLQCSGPGGSVTRQIDILVDGEPIDGNPSLVYLTAPTGLRVIKQTDSYLQLTWAAPPEEERVVAYRVLSGDRVIDEVDGSSTLVRNLIPGTRLVYRIQAVDDKGNLSAASKPLEVNLPEADTKRDSITLYPSSDTFLAKSTFKALGESSRLSLSSARTVLIKFPIEMLGKERKISSAFLILTPEKQYGDALVELYHVADDWHERTASRDYRDNSCKIRWQQQLGDWVDATGSLNGTSPLRRVHLIESGPQGAVSIDVTVLVNQWLRGRENHGIILVYAEGSPQDFHSKDSDSPKKWPRLLIKLAAD
jgi:hypothetical protein